MDGTTAVAFRAAEEAEYPEFLRMIYEHTADYLEPALTLLGMDQAEFEYLFRTRGEVTSIILDDEVAGFYWTEEREGTLHVHGLFVKPEFQKRGIARRALEQVEHTVSAEVTGFELGVHRDNHRAKAIYEQAGYRVTRELGDFDFYILTKPR